MDYEIYHDESKEHGYWHGILLVPITSKSRIIEHLEQAREYVGYEHPLGIKSITHLLHLQSVTSLVASSYKI